LVWSPLKLRNMQNARRPSLLPSRPSNNEVQ
jgi:kinesin family protein C2/C3